ncbi:MAG: hypothetical protein K2K73_03350, partial [Ureaplasma sp.]|nr:hypothetical protein [Ureaplasma sp.]
AAVLINSTNASKEADLENNKVIFTKTNMENLRSSLQNEINQYKLTRTKFSNQNYIDFVKNNLYSKDTKVGHLIIDVKLNSDAIEIYLNKRNEYDLDGINAIDNLATYNSKDKIITLNISTLKFYSAYQIENLGGLYDLFNDKVLESINLYTSNEFNNYVNNNENAIKTEIAKVLNFIITTRSIDSSAIKNVVFDDNLKQLQITLNDDYIIYDANNIDNANVALNNNVITISNFSFYTAYQVSNNIISSLENVVQNYINLATNQYTVDEFNDQLDSQNFKTEIANHLTIPENVINRIEYSNDTLKIIPNSMIKFVSETSSTLTEINVTNLKFYTAQDLVNLENLYTRINNYIIDSSRKFTVSEFKNDIQFNETKIKDLVAQNLYISENQKINPNDVLSVSFNETLKQLEINLASNYKKYNLVPTNNVSLKNNQLIISNFTFYEGIEIEPTKLDNFQTNIQGFINELANQYTLNEFTNQIDSTGFKNLIVASLGIPSAAINEIKFENSTLIINSTDMKKFVSNSTSNILDNGEIKVNNLKFYTEQNLVKLDNLYNSINNYIINANRKFTSVEFSNYTNTIDNNAIKNLVA